MASKKASKAGSRSASRSGKTDKSRHSDSLTMRTPDWKQYVSSRALNAYTWSVHVIYLVEFNGDHIKYLDLFNATAAQGQRACINIVSYNSLINSLHRNSTPNDDLHPELRHIYPAASEEAMKLLHRRTAVGGIDKKSIPELPMDILAKLIKLEILRLKFNHITLMEKKRRLKSEIKEEFSEMLGDPKRCIAQSIKSQGRPTAQLNAPNVSNLADAEPKKETSTKLQKHDEEWKKWDDIDDSPKSGPNLYVVLSTFYDPKLIIKLIDNDIPVIGIIQMRRDNDTLDNVSKFKIDRANSINFVRRVNEISDFWHNYAELIKIPKYYAKLENTAFVTFKTPTYIFDSKKKVSNVDQIALYNDLSYAIYEIEDILRQYAAFMKNMRIFRTHESQIHHSSKFKVYNGLLKLVPSECITIPIILNCMLEQVVSMMDSLRQSNFDGTDILTIVSDEQESNPSSKTPKTILPYNGKFKTKFIRIYEKIANETEMLLPTANYETCIKTKPVTIAYGNDIKYKSFHINDINLEQITLNVLFYHIVPSLWRSIPYLPNDEAVLYDCHITKLLQETPNKTIDKDVLWHYLHVKIFEKMVCTSIKKLSEITNPDTGSSRNDNENDACSSTGKQFNLGSVEKLNPLMKNYRSKSVTLNDILFSNDLAKLFSRFDFEVKPVSNIFDTKNCTSYERLTCSVMLQKLYDASLKYNCIDYHHFEFTDVLLLQFHNSYPKNGIIKEDWEVFLPTGVCFRDFVSYVYNEHQYWIKEYESTYKQLCKIEEKNEAKRLHMQKFNEELLKIAPDTLFNESLRIVPEVTDYLLPGSIKDFLFKQKQEELDTMITKTQARKSEASSNSTYKKKKKPKEKNKRSPTVDRSLGKPSGQQQMESNLFPAYPPDSPYHKIILPVYPSDEDIPYEFIGYDLGTNRIQFNGQTQYFHSSDQSFIKVETVQKTFAEEKALNIEIHKHGHSLYLYSIATPDPTTLMSKEFMFHITVANGAIMSFSTPKELQLTCDSDDPNESKSSVIKRNLLSSISDVLPSVPMQSGQKLPKITEIVTNEPVPTTTSPTRQISPPNPKPMSPVKELSEKEDELQKNKSLKHDLFELDSEATTFETESEIIYDTLKVEQNDTFVNKPPELHDPEDKIFENESKQDKENKFQILKPPSDDKQPEINNRFRQRMAEEKRLHSFLQHEDIQVLQPKSVNESLFLKRKMKFLAQLEEARTNRYPCFKIHSSKLHTYRYIKRIKPYITVNVRGIVKKLVLKPILKYSLVNRVIKTSKKNENSKQNFEKWKNVTTRFQEPTIPLYFNLNCSWPNGLSVKTIQSTDEFMPYYIKQTFLPSQTNFDELNRCFLSNGQLLIFYKGGMMKILCSDSTIYSCQVDGFKPISLKPNFKKIHHNRMTTMCFKFRKILKQKIHIRKHLISNQYSLRIPYTRRMYIKKQKYCYRIASKLFKNCPDRTPIPEYNVLTAEGNHTTIRNNKVCGISQKLFVDITTDLSHNEVYIEREDGTTTFLHGENGNMNVLFPDGTRITTWFEIEKNEIVIDFTDDEYQELLIALNTEKIKRAIFGDDESTSSSDIDESINFEPFVSVILICTYEHPKYARVCIKNGVEFGTEISMLDDVTINLDRIGQYVCDLDDSTKISLLSSMICFEQVTCCSCATKSSSIINYRPFIQDNNCNENSYYVSNVNTQGHEIHIDFDGNTVNDNVETDITDDVNHRCKSYMDNKTIDKRFFLLKRQFNGSEFISDIEQKQYLHDCVSKKFSAMYNEENVKEVDNSTIVTYGIEKTYTDSWLQPLANMLPMYLKRKDTLPSTYYPDSWLSPFHNRESHFINMNYYNSCCMDALFLNQSMSPVTSTHKPPIAIIRRSFTSLTICCDQSIKVGPLYSNKADGSVKVYRAIKRPYKPIYRQSSALDFRDRWIRQQNEAEYYKQLFKKRHIPQYFSKDMETIMFDFECQSDTIMSTKSDPNTSHELTPTHSKSSIKHSNDYKVDIVGIAKKWAKHGYIRYQPQFKKFYTTATQTDCVYVCPVQEDIPSINDETSEFCVCQKKSRIPVYSQRAKFIKKKARSTTNVFDECLIKPKSSSRPVTVCGTGTRPTLQRMSPQISAKESFIDEENHRRTSLKLATVKIARSKESGVAQLKFVEHKPKIIPIFYKESVLAENSKQIGSVISRDSSLTRNADDVNLEKPRPN